MRMRVYVCLVLFLILFVLRDSQWHVIVAYYSVLGMSAKCSPVKQTALETFSLGTVDFFCGSLLLFMFHVCLCYAVLSVLCSLVITCLERADILALSCVIFSFCYNKLVGTDMRGDM